MEPNIGEPSDGPVNYNDYNNYEAQSESIPADSDNQLSNSYPGFSIPTGSKWGRRPPLSRINTELIASINGSRNPNRQPLVFKLITETTKNTKARLAAEILMKKKHR